MVPFIVAIVFIILANWVRSAFLQIMAGLVTIAAGINWIALAPDEWINLVIGGVLVMVGLYELIMVGVDLWRER